MKRKKSTPLSEAVKRYRLLKSAEKKLEFAERMLYKLTDRLTDEQFAEYMEITTKHDQKNDK